MPGLLIKDLPTPLHRRLASRAEANQRSMAKEALVILADALADRAGPPTLAEIDRLRVQGTRPLTRRLLSLARSPGRP